MILQDKKNWRIFLWMRTFVWKLHTSHKLKIQNIPPWCRANICQYRESSGWLFWNDELSIVKLATLVSLLIRTIQIKNVQLNLTLLFTWMCNVLRLWNANYVVLREGNHSGIRLPGSGGGHRRLAAGSLQNVIKFYEIYPRLLKSHTDPCPSLWSWLYL